MKASTQHRIVLRGRHVEYRVVRSSAARKLRVRVGPDGVEVVQPLDRKIEDVAVFLGRNQAWLLDQLERVRRLKGVRRAPQRHVGGILFRGEPVHLRVEMTDSRARNNVVQFQHDEILLQRGVTSRTSLARSLENWLRRQARSEVEKELELLEVRLHQRPRRVYVMGQRTKWGNCSSRRNLSFNWRLILAPEFVLRYIVRHEAVHLAIPDHSHRFWLTVQSLCGDTGKARAWLRAHEQDLRVDLDVALGEESRRWAC